MTAQEGPVNDADAAMARFEDRQASKPKKTIGQKIREQIELAVEAGDPRIVPPFRTLPRELRPRAQNLAELRKTRVSFPEPAPPGPVPVETIVARAERRRRHRVASASLRRNRR